jgi:hypothetical protein
MPVFLESKKNLKVVFNVFEALNENSNGQDGS